MTQITITHQLDTDTAFGVTLSNPPEAVFISAKVARAAKIEIGFTYNAQLAPNPQENDRTPWQALTLTRVGGVSGAPTPRGSVLDFLQGGGVWTPEGLCEHLQTNDVPLMRGTLLDLFRDGACAKFELRTSPSATRPAKEWFTCYPDRADVDEWGDEE